MLQSPAPDGAADARGGRVMRVLDEYGALTFRRPKGRVVSAGVKSSRRLV